MRLDSSCNELNPSTRLARIVFGIMRCTTEKGQRTDTRGANGVAPVPFRTASSPSRHRAPCRAAFGDGIQLHGSPAGWSGARAVPDRVHRSQRTRRVSVPACPSRLAQKGREHTPRSPRLRVLCTTHRADHHARRPALPRKPRCFHEAIPPVSALPIDFAFLRMTPTNQFPTQK